MVEEGGLGYLVRKGTPRKRKGLQGFLVTYLSLRPEAYYASGSIFGIGIRVRDGAGDGKASDKCDGETDEGGLHCCGWFWTLGKFDIEGDLGFVEECWCWNNFVYGR